MGFLGFHWHSCANQGKESPNLGKPSFKKSAVFLTLFKRLSGFLFSFCFVYICMFVLALARFQVFVLPKSGSPTCVDIIFVGRTYEFRTSWISFAFPTLTQIFIISSFNVQHGMTRRESMDLLTIFTKELQTIPLII